MWTDRMKRDYFHKLFKDGWDKIYKMEKKLQDGGGDRSVTDLEELDKYFCMPMPFGMPIPYVERTASRLGHILPWQAEEVKAEAEEEGSEAPAVPQQSRKRSAKKTSRQRKRRSGVATRTSPRIRRRSPRLVAK